MSLMNRSPGEATDSNPPRERVAIPMRKRIAGNFLGVIGPKHEMAAYTNAYTHMLVAYTNIEDTYFIVLDAVIVYIAAVQRGAFRLSA